MDFELLEKSLLRAATIVEKLPDKFRDRVMEALVDAILADDNTKRHSQIAAADQRVAVGEQDGESPRLIGAVRAFLAKHSIDYDSFSKLVQHDGAGWSIYIDPDAKGKSEGQIQMALLASLRTFLSTGNFAFDAEQLKDAVKAQGYWDGGNYWKFFGKKFFSKLPTSKDPRGVLNGDGQSGLAELIKRRL